MAGPGHECGPKVDEAKAHLDAYESVALSRHAYPGPSPANLEVSRICKRT